MEKGFCTMEPEQENSCTSVWLRLDGSRTNMMQTILTDYEACCEFMEEFLCTKIWLHSYVSSLDQCVIQNKTKWQKFRHLLIVTPISSHQTCLNFNKILFSARLTFTAPKKGIMRNLNMELCFRSYFFLNFKVRVRVHNFPL